jgi:ADP-heptose:LPS heptosyltransferase
MTPAHLIISRTDNIGDVVLTLPLAGYLKSLYPALRIGFLCRGYAAAVVRQCRAIDYVLELEALTDPVADLRATGADTIIFGKPDRKLAKAAWQAKIAQRIGTSHKLFNWLYCNRLAHFSRVKSALHEAQLNFALLRPLGIKFTPTLAQIPALYQLEKPIYRGPVELSGDAFNLVLHPKSNGNGREWPIGHFAALAKLLQARPDIKLWVSGSAAEGEWLAQHGRALLDVANVTSLCGRLSLAELAGFIAAADGLIASGTGPLHMSAALGQRTLGLFPPVKPIHAGRWGPIGERAQVLCQSIPCAGCADAATCRCMLDITPESVAQVVLEWASESAATR